MVDIDDIRNAIVATMESVTGIGRVHSYQRFASRNSDLSALYEHADTNGARLHGWHLRRLRTSERPGGDGCRRNIQHRWELRGFLSLDDADATEIWMDQIIERLRDAFRADDTLGGLIDSCIVGQEAGLQLLESTPVMFAGVLCHSARLGLTTRHYQ